MSGETIRDVIIKVAIQAGDSSSFKSVAEELQRDLQSKIGGIDVKPFGEHAVEEMRAITTAAKEAASAIASVNGHPGIGMPGYGASVTNRASSIISQNISQMKSESGGAGLDDQHWAKLEARMQKQAESFIREQDRESAAAERAYDKEAADAVRSYSKIMKERQKAADDAEKDAERQEKAAEKAYDAEASAAVRSYSKIMKERAAKQKEEERAYDEEANAAIRSYSRIMSDRKRQQDQQASEDKRRSDEQYQAINHMASGAGRFAAGAGSLYAFTGDQEMHKLIKTLGMVHGLHSIYGGLSGIGAGAAGMLGLGGAAGAALSVGLPIAGTIGAGAIAYNMLAHHERQQLQFQHMESGRDISMNHAAMQFHHNMRIAQMTNRMTQGLTPEQAMTHGRNAMYGEEIHSQAFNEDVNAYNDNAQSGFSKPEWRVAQESAARHRNANFQVQTMDLEARKSATAEKLSGLDKEEKEAIATRDAIIADRGSARSVHIGQKSYLETHAEGSVRGGKVSAEESAAEYSGVPSLPGFMTKGEYDVDVPHKEERNLSVAQQREGMEIDSSKIQNEVDQTNELEKANESLLSIAERRLALQTDQVKVTAEEAKIAREKAQDSQKAAVQEKSAARNQAVESGSREIGDMWEEKRMQDKGKRIKSQQEANIKAGRNKNQGVEQFTQYEKGKFGNAGNKYSYLAKEQSAEFDANFGLEHEHNAETVNETQNQADRDKSEADRTQAQMRTEGASGISKIEDAGKQMGEAVKNAIDLDGVVTKFNEAMAELRAHFEEAKMRINSSTQ